MTWGRYRVCLDPEITRVVLDFETTGLKAHRHEIIEVGAVRIEPILGRWTGVRAFIKPSRQLSPKIIALTGITQAMVDVHGRDAHTVLTELVEFIGNAPIVSYNATFDLAFLNAACERYSISVAKRGGHSCALRLARKAIPGLSSYQLSAVSKVFSLNTADEHRALGDARRAALIYQIASDFHRERLGL